MFTLIKKKKTECNNSSGIYKNRPTFKWKYFNWIVLKDLKNEIPPIKSLKSEIALRPLGF